MQCVLHQDRLQCTHRERHRHTHTQDMSDMCTKQWGSAHKHPCTHMHTYARTYVHTHCTSCTSTLPDDTQCTYSVLSRILKWGRVGGGYAIIIMGGAAASKTLIGGYKAASKTLIGGYKAASKTLIGGYNFFRSTHTHERTYIHTYVCVL